VPPEQDRLNVVPWIAAIAVVLAAAATGVSVVALARQDGDTDQAQTSAGTAATGGHAAAAHAAPLPIAGIREASSDRGATPLAGRRRRGTLEFELEARPVWWRIFGDRRLAAWAYNGIVPGPTIRVANGERIRVHFRNRLPDETTVHWHGVGVPNRADGVPGITQEPIEPGQSYVYEFTARPAGDPAGSGTFLYHSHVDEDRQMSVGLSGTLIIDPPPGRPVPAYSMERTLVFSEWTADAATGRTRGVMEAEGNLPNFFTINGKSYPDTEPIRVEAGEPVLLRLVNAGQFAHPIHLHGTSFEVVARDGHPARPEGRRDAVTLASGERADIAFSLPRGKWALHCHIGHHMTNDGEGPGGLLTIVEAS
jgi:FtsP/CotA-like multicopper oxidase with cupredoxin domain